MYSHTHTHTHKHTHTHTHTQLQQWSPLQTRQSVKHKVFTKSLIWFCWQHRQYWPRIVLWERACWCSLQGWSLVGPVGHCWAKSVQRDQISLTLISVLKKAGMLKMFAFFHIVLNMRTVMQICTKNVMVYNGKTQYSYTVLQFFFFHITLKVCW